MMRICVSMPCPSIYQAKFPPSLRERRNRAFKIGALMDRTQLHTNTRLPLGNDRKAEPTGGNRLVLDHVAAQIAGNFLGQNPRLNESLNPRTARAIPWTAGVLSAGLVVLLSAALGSPRAGLAAGLIMAMHPQHVQWSSEISDAALSQFFFGTVLLCLLNAMRTNAWRWWTALGLGLTTLSFGHPIVIMAVFLLNGLAAAANGFAEAPPTE